MLTPSPAQPHAAAIQYCPATTTPCKIVLEQGPPCADAIVISHGWTTGRPIILSEFRISCQVTSQLPYQHEIKIRDKILMGVVLVRKDTATHLWKQRLPSIYADVQLLRSCFYILMHTVEMFLYLHKNHFCFPL